MDFFLNADAEIYYRILRIESGIRDISFLTWKIFDLFDFADEMIESGDPGREALAMTFRRNVGVGEKYIRLKEMYQCPFCGRMIIEDNSGDFCFFAPEEHNEKNLLDYGAECEKKHI